jgi:hypothetical protein
MVLYIRRNVLVVGMGALEARLIGMRLRVVPVQLFFSLPDFVAVPLDQNRQAIKDEPFENHKANLVSEEDLARDPCKRMSSTNECKGGTMN